VCNLMFRLTIFYLLLSILQAIRAADHVFAIKENFPNSSRMNPNPKFPISVCTRIHAIEHKITFLGLTLRRRVVALPFRARRSTHAPVRAMIPRRRSLPTEERAERTRASLAAAPEVAAVNRWPPARRRALPPSRLERKRRRQPWSTAERARLGPAHAHPTTVAIASG
jgi:hypothetical protein